MKAKPFIYKMTNREHWLAVDGYDNYEISDYGRVRNITTKRILKPGKYGKGYSHVVLYKQRKSKSIKIHKLVGFAFLPERENNKMVLDHIDRNRFNNMASNLRWITFAQNCQNTTKRKGTSSIYKGCSWDVDCEKWRCQIKIHGKTKYLGCFDDEYLAALTYNIYAVKYQDYPVLNEVEEPIYISTIDK
jgi:hypothetical protein